MPKEPYPNKHLHDRLAETHDRVVQLELGGAANAADIAKMKGELESLQGLLTKGFDPSFVEKRLDGMDRGLADHEVRISGLEAGFTVLVDETARAHARITDVEGVVAEDRKVTRNTARRVTAIEDHLSAGFPFAGALVAVGSGIAAGVVWARRDWTGAFTASGLEVTTRSPADYGVAAWGVGIAVASIVFGFVVAFTRSLRRARVEEAEMTAQAKDVFNRHRTTVQAEEHIPDTTPTEVLPAHAGKTS